MKVPVSWLRDYVEFDDTPQGLADKLTFSGIEVEGIETVGSTYDGIVVGEVLSVERHPDADRLTVCRVNTGTEEVQVVCGAPNVAAGMRAPFAPVGVTLADGTKLKKAKIRGVESFGMLCAEDELGISDSHDGLMVLDASLPAGRPLAEVLGPPEVVLELEITPNRPDCLSLIGIAREVAALYGTSLRLPDAKLNEQEPAVDSLTRVEIEYAEGCPRYTARILSGIAIQPSPSWMQKRLTLAGIRPINNVVDITNYVMLETGHPLHAFDQTLLKEGRIVVRRAKPGEKMATLDEIERTLTPDTLLIADAARPVALAGVMGGAGSEIRDETTAVLLESACFEPLGIRATSRRLGLSTESSYRFERGVDVNGVEWASRRAAALMAEHAGGRVARGVVDAYPKPRQPWPVTCRWDFVRSLTAMDVSNDRIEEIFTSLGLRIAGTSATECTVEVPTFRGDLEREVDLIEEVARIHGLDHVADTVSRSQIVPDAEDRRTRALYDLRAKLVGLGLTEIMNYSLVSESLLNLFEMDMPDGRIVMPNPISADQSILRTSLIPQLTVSLGYNHAHQVAEALFFEIGRVYERAEGGGTREEERVSIGLLGPVGRGPFDKRRALKADELFLWMKGMIEQLFETQSISMWLMEPAARPCFEPGYAGTLRVDGAPIGVMGVLASGVRNEWRMADPVAVAELAVEPLLAHFGSITSIQPVPVYPSVSRDVAMIVDASVRNEDVLKVMREAAPKELEKMELFDIFIGEAIGAGKKSMAYSLTYRSLTRTLTDEEANAYHDKVKDALRRALSAAVREG